MITPEKCNFQSNAPQNLELFSRYVSDILYAPDLNGLMLERDLLEEHYYDPNFYSDISLPKASFRKLLMVRNQKNKTSSNGFPINA